MTMNQSRQDVRVAIFWTTKRTSQRWAISIRVSFLIPTTTTKTFLGSEYSLFTKRSHALLSRPSANMATSDTSRVRYPGRLSERLVESAELHLHAGIDTMLYNACL